MNATFPTGDERRRSQVRPAEGPPHRSPSPPDDHEVLSFLDFCRQLSRDERIAVIKSFRPEATVSQIADAVGVSERTVIRSSSYRRLREIDQARQPAPSQWRGRTKRRIGSPVR